MRPPTPRRERILSYGGPGSGKTRGWLSIADLYVKTKTPGRFYVLDTDDTYWASVEEYPAVEESGIVEQIRAYDFPGYQEAAKEFKAKATADDWVIADLFDKGWEDVQNYYSEQVFGADKGAFFLSMRKQVEESNKQVKNFQPFEGWTDWPTIKALHAEWANDLLFRHPAHVYLVAGMKPVARTGQTADSKDIIDAFGHVGAKPGGEKGLAAHGVNTVLKFTQTKAGEEWVLDTAKDRGGREPLIRKAVPKSGFGMAYLVGVAGWKLK